MNEALPLPDRVPVTGTWRERTVVHRSGGSGVDAPRAAGLVSTYDRLARSPDREEWFHGNWMDSPGRWFA